MSSYSIVKRLSYPSIKNENRYKCQGKCTCQFVTNRSNYDTMQYNDYVNNKGMYFQQLKGGNKNKKENSSNQKIFEDIKDKLDHSSGCNGGTLCNCNKYRKEYTNDMNFDELRVPDHVYFFGSLRNPNESKRFMGNI